MSLKQWEQELAERYVVGSRRLTLSPKLSLSILTVDNVTGLVDQADHEDELPFWAELWPSSIALAAHLSEQELDQLRVLELGCGLGLAGIGAAMAGASVLQTDFCADALLFARVNAVRNGVTGTRQQRADWRCFRVDGLFDLILGADILYEPKTHTKLIEIMTAHLAPGGSVLIADPGRAYAARFMNRLDEEAPAFLGSWSWQEIIVPGDDGKHVDLFQLKTPAVSPPDADGETARHL